MEVFSIVGEIWEAGIVPLKQKSQREELMEMFKFDKGKAKKCGKLLPVTKDPPLLI